MQASECDGGAAGLIGLKRAARPEEIARSVLYLASDNATFVTGSTAGIGTATAAPD